ncbi:hypothetical protein JCM11251_005173 [Rhodosporidiobolus azoricus]
MAAATPAFPLVHLDSSFNSPANSPSHLGKDSPCSRSGSLSPTKRRTGAAARRKSVLAAKDSNKDGLLVDVEQEEGGLNRTPGHTRLLRYTQSSSETSIASLGPSSLSTNFPLSLLDKSPSLLKAHLRTPLVPLGSPITARKTRRTVSQQEASPSLRVTDEKRSFSSPTPAALGALPPSSSPASSPAAHPVRFSPISTPPTRTSPRKARFAETPTLPSAIRNASHPLSALPKHLATFATPLQRFGAHPLSAASEWTPGSPFPYSPYASPAVRTHASYQDDELTDCDADGSFYDLDGEDEQSLSYPCLPSPAPVEGDEEVDELAEAVAPLSLEDEEVRYGSDEEVIPEADEAESRIKDSKVEALLTVEETSFEVITETELATSDEEVEEQAAQDDVIDELGPVEAAFAKVGELGDDNAFSGEDEQQAEEAVALSGPAELVTSVEGKKGLALEEPSELPLLPIDRTPTPPSPFLAASSIPLDDLRVPAVAFTVPSAPTTPVTLRAPSPGCADTTPQAATTPVQQQTPPQRRSPRRAQRTPLAAGSSTQTAVTSAAHLLTPSVRAPPSALQAPSTRTMAGAAPTAQRQLTKLSSLAVQRAAGLPPSTNGTKPALTSLIPGSAALHSRRLIAPVRSGVARPASSVPTSVAREVPSALSATKDGGEVPVQAEQLKRPSSALSTSSVSSGSGSAPLAQGTALRPRTLLKSGLKPPGSTTTSTVPTKTHPVSSLAARTAPSALAKPTTAAAPRPTRTALTRTVPSAAPASRLARAASAANTTSLHPSTAPVPRAPSPLLQTSSAPSLSTSRAPSPALPLPTRTARTPRAALAAVAGAVVEKQAPAPLPLPLPLPTASSPVKRRAARLVGGKVELAKPALQIVADIAPGAPIDPPHGVCAATSENASAAPAAAIVAPVPLSPVQQPFASPRLTSTRPPASPIRSPRRVLASSQATASTGAASSALSAPPEKLPVAIPAAEIFGSAPSVVKMAPIRATRTRRTQPAPAEAPTAAPAVRTTRRTAVAVSAPPAPAVRAVPPTSTPVVRSARRPLRKVASDETASAIVDHPVGEDAPSSGASSSSASSADLVPSFSSIRPMPSFHPTPSITQAELSRITQRNTKKNQQPFNKLKVEVVHLDYDRPPSPTSKIRRSAEALDKEGSAGRPSTKEGREARAAKRRNALRASVDGSEMAAIAAELGASIGSEDQGPPGPPMEHFRAPGDDEQFFTPVRAGPLVGLKKAAGKKKASGVESATASPTAKVDNEEEKEKRRVKWDKALVYEGAREVALAKDESILKPASLDEWGNSTTATTSFGKAEPVLITKRVFLNDDEEEE